jgi:hypothetical protein
MTMQNDTVKVLSQLTENLPVGTNLGLLHFLWMLVSGALLASRGALFPALKSAGLSDGETRRAWGAFRSGQWSIRELVRVWRTYVKAQNEWVVHRIEGYVPVTADLTAFWRPTLKNCPSQHYEPTAGQALPAVTMGLVGEVGELNGQRLALIRQIERVRAHDGSEKQLWADVLKQIKKALADDEVLVVDAGVKISDLHTAGIERFVIRLAVNFTAHRNVLPAYKGGRKAAYGALVRPLGRQGKKRYLPATPPDETVDWQVKGRVITVKVWRHLVLPKTVPHPHNKIFDIYAFHDPVYNRPWLLATPVKLAYSSVHAFYTDRWPVEQIPLSAKQMLGAHRQFVHNPEAVQRLPELALFAGSTLSFLAAAAPPIPTGFWDRRPKATPGRFRRALFGKPFPKDALLSPQLREKKSITTHLPKGILARRQNTAQTVPVFGPSLS